MRVVNLIENLPGQTGLPCEHGLSFYIEAEGHRILMDTGATGLFADNAEALGVDLRQVDLAVLSHGHYDHGGGLIRFALENEHAPIYVRRGAEGGFYHQSGEELRYIGLSEEAKNLSRLKFLESGECCQISEGVELFAGVNGRRLWPEGNRELVSAYGDGVVQDAFAHEQYLALFLEGKRVLVSGCAHNGILNILDHYRQLYGGDPQVVFSGFHMARKQGLTGPDVADIRQTAAELAGMSTIFYTGHCTGIEAYEMMKEIMGEKIQYLHCGESVAF